MGTIFRHGILWAISFQDFSFHVTHQWIFPIFRTKKSSLKWGKSHAASQWIALRENLLQETIVIFHDFPSYMGFSMFFLYFPSKYGA